MPKFPARIIKFEFMRPSLDVFSKYKSNASKKRHIKRGNFKIQVVSLHIFRNGKLIITGCQSKCDFLNICTLIKAILKHSLL